jgi:hypothetical protein
MKSAANVVEYFSLTCGGGRPPMVGLGLGGCESRSYRTPRHCRGMLLLLTCQWGWVLSAAGVLMVVRRKLSMGVGGLGC